jgi:hypothetical protein
VSKPKSILRKFGSTRIRPPESGMRFFARKRVEGKLANCL